jgi:hypothetical protein
MVELLGNLNAWMQAIVAWLQNVTGLTIKDLSLFTGGIVMVISVLLLGAYTGKPRYREGARVGWCLLVVAAVLVIWGLYHHNPSQQG